MQPLRKLISTRIYLLSFLEALIATACYIVSTFLYDPIGAVTYLLYEGGLQHIGVVTMTFMIASYLFDFYKQIHVRSRLVLLLQLLQLIGIIFLTEAALAFINKDIVPPQPIVLGGSAITLIVLIPWRLFFRPAVWNLIGSQTVIFVGFSDAVEHLSEAFQQQPDLGVQVVGYVAQSNDQASASPVLGGYAQLPAIISKVKPARVIVGADGLRDKSVLKILFNMRSAGLTVESAADAYEAIFGRIYSRAVEPYTVIFRNELSAKPGSVALQSIYTNVLALIAVVITLPLMVLIAVALKLTRRGPILVNHVCIGLHGIPFSRYRFNCNVLGGGLLTRVLVKYKLEALPQIVNIVRGEMALIGPRAERVEFSQIIDDLIPFYRQEHSVKPGVMGWSQLHCDVDSTEDTLARIEYDLYYIKHISLVLDAYILLRGLKSILSNPVADEKLSSLRKATA